MSSAGKWWDEHAELHMFDWRELEEGAIESLEATTASPGHRLKCDGMAQLLVLVVV